MKTDTKGRGENRDVPAKGRGEARDAPRRRRHRGSGNKKQPGVVHRTERTDANPPEVPALLKTLLQEVADKAKAELASKGRVTAKAFFVYEDETAPKTVSVALSFRSEQQKDALYQRIRDKASQEGARAVAIMLTGEAGLLTLTASTGQVRAAASIRYLFDGKSKTVTRWDMQWQNESPPR